MLLNTLTAVLVTCKTLQCRGAAYYANKCESAINDFCQLNNSESLSIVIGLILLIGNLVMNIWAALLLLFSKLLRGRGTRKILLFSHHDGR